MKFERDGEWKHEVIEAMGNRDGGRCGTGRDGRGMGGSGGTILAARV
jgi:hypothetical protein